MLLQTNQSLPRKPSIPVELVEAWLAEHPDKRSTGEEAMRLNISEPKYDVGKLNPQGQSRIKPTAKLIGVHHQTLRRWWNSGRFPKPIEVNGILLFENKDILNFLQKKSFDDLHPEKKSKVSTDQVGWSHREQMETLTAHALQGLLSHQKREAPFFDPQLIADQAVSVASATCNALNVYFHRNENNYKNS